MWRWRMQWPVLAATTLRINFQIVLKLRDPYIIVLWIKQEKKLKGSVASLKVLI